MSDSCWETIGIFGDASCSKLLEFGRCLRCTEYQQAGRTLFDREIPGGFREEWASQLAKGKERSSTRQMACVVFRLKNEWFGLSILFMIEIVTARFCHSIPFRNNRFLLGVVNISGVLLPCLSAESLLELQGECETPAGNFPAWWASGGNLLENGNEPLPDQGASGKKRMIVAGHLSHQYVFPVDEVLCVKQVFLNDLQQVPTTLSRTTGNLVDGIFMAGERQVGRLDGERLFEAMERRLKE